VEVNERSYLNAFLHTYSAHEPLDLLSPERIPARADIQRIAADMVAESLGHHIDDWSQWSRLSQLKPGRR
jgi:hypothetical protein